MDNSTVDITDAHNEGSSSPLFLLCLMPLLIIIILCCIKCYPHRYNPDFCFSSYFNGPVDNIVFHDVVETIEFGSSFNHPIDNVKWPPKLHTIEFGSSFNQPIHNIEWPPSLKTICFGRNFNQSLDNLPDTITMLKFYSINMKINNLPPSLEQIIIYGKLGNSLENLGKIPFGCVVVVEPYDNKILLQNP